MNETDTTTIPYQNESSGSEKNAYMKIFQSQVNIQDHLSLENIESLFNNIDHLYKTMGCSFHLLTTGTNPHTNTI